MISGLKESQKHRIRIRCVVLIILPRLSALRALWGSRFGPKSFQVGFCSFRAVLGITRAKNTGNGILASCWSFFTGYQLSRPSRARDSVKNCFKFFSDDVRAFWLIHLSTTPDSNSSSQIGPNRLTMVFGSFWNGNAHVRHQLPRPDNECRVRVNNGSIELNLLQGTTLIRR